MPVQELVTVKEKNSLKIEVLPIEGYEKVYLITDAKVGLKAIVAIHNTSLGTALGGTRIYPYASFDQALTDALRLSKGMTYKSAIAEVGFGGGKAVIIADPKTDKSEELLLAYAEALNILDGQFITAEDSGCGLEDMKILRKKTKYLVGLPHEKSSGDPSRFTAWGTKRGIQAACKKIFGSDDLSKRKVVIQGIGNVGESLLDFLFWEGAEIIISDLDSTKMKRLSKKYYVKAIAPNEVFYEECDIFAPCALGGIINQETIPLLRCKAVAGCANNQLLLDEDAQLLMERNILYAPDFVINAGGLMNVAQELTMEGYNPIQPRMKVHNIYKSLLSIFDIAEKNHTSTHHAALALADYRIRYKIGKMTENPYFHHTQS